VGGCRSFPLGQAGPEETPGAGRLTRPLPPDLVARFTPVHPGFNLSMALEETDRAYERYHFQFSTFSEVYLDFRTVSGTYYRTLKGPAGPAPLVLVSPILGGAKDDYLACRVFGRWAARDGFSSFYLHQDADILTGERDGLELDRLLRENILANRKTLDILIAERPEIDGRRLGSLGISLGAVKNVVLIAVEPRLIANVLCLAGGDVPRILLESRERMVMRYLRRRRLLDGLSAEEVAAELKRELLAEPMALAEFVPPERVYLFLGSFDDKVPYSTGLALRQALGRPLTEVFPLGHYTGILAAPYSASRGFAWMAERFREADRRPAPQVPAVTQKLSNSCSASETLCWWGRQTLPHVGRDTRPPPPRRLVGAGAPSAR
jgi:hypothetical protein